MNCEHAAQIHAYYDNDLTPAQRAGVESHLAVCAECRALLQDLRDLTQMLAAVPLPEMPPQAVNRMYGSWWAAQQVRDRGVRRLAGALTAAAAAILVIVPTLSPVRTIELNEDRPVAWEDTVAFIPPAGVRDGPNVDLVRVAQLIASDVASEQSQ
jgi:anti-sigma factor RsiW